MRRPAVLIALTTLAACNADIGEPTGPVIVQDAGAEAAADASKMAVPSTNKGPGVDCGAAEECQSGICFVGGQASYCSLRCTNDNATTICSTQPFDGTCNKQGYCRRP